MMRLPLSALVASFATATLLSAAVPAVFSGLLEEGVPTRAEVGHVLPPQEYDVFAAKIQAAAEKDIKWFEEFSAKAAPGEPLPYDEKLGLTPEEHKEYLKLWDKREFKTVEPVVLLLRKTVGDVWVITATDAAGVLSTLRYSPEKNTFSSPNGEMKPGTDVDAGPNTVYGEWKGKRWENMQEDSLGKSNETIAIGKLAKTGHGLLIYAFTELTSQGTPVVDRRLVVRFAPGKAEAAKPAAPAKPATPSKPTSKPAVKPKGKR